MTTASTNEETSLKRYLEDQKFDPIETQLNHIHLDIIKSLDRDRITDRTKYDLQQVIRSGQYTGWAIPRIPKQMEAKEVISYSNLPPHQMQVGGSAYQRFTFKQLYRVKNPPERRLTFNVYEHGDPLAKGFLHKNDVSFRDQEALNEIRKKQLADEVSKIERLARAKNPLINAVGINVDTVQGRINHLANPLNVTDVRSDDPLVQFDVIARNLQQSLNDLPQQGRKERTALEAIRYAHNLHRFNKTTIQNRRGKGKGNEIKSENRSSKPTG